MPLCQRCLPLTIDELVDNDVLFHPNIASLKASGENGCAFCLLCWHALLKVINKRQLNNLLAGESAWGEGERWTPTIWLRGWHFHNSGREGAKIDVSCGVSMAVCIDGEWEPNRNPMPYVGARLAVYELPGQQSKYQLVGRRSTADQNPELHIQLIQKWLDNCRTNHKACNARPDDEMPTRVIDVGDTNNKPSVRLVSTEGMREHDTYNDMTQGVSITEVAKTHRELILLARSLGIRYVWIDALCIIQGDTADWERESRTMARVYGNAVLTVIAGRSAGTKDGFITNAFQNPASCQLPVSATDSPNTLGVGLSRSQNLGPTSSRGWCLQERILSRRAIIFAEEQLVFRCVTQNIWEDGETKTILTPPPKPSAAQGALAPHERALKEWYNTIFQFSQCALSNPHDIFAASTALAQQTSAVLNSRFLAGIWECDIVRGLLWRPCYHFTNVKFLDIPTVRPKGTKLTGSGPVIRAPSWSWAAVEGPVGQVAWNAVQVARYRDGGKMMIRPKFTDPERWSLDDKCGVDALHMPACELQFVGRVVRMRVMEGSVEEWIQEGRKKARHEWGKFPRIRELGYSVLLGKDTGVDGTTDEDGLADVVAVGFFDVVDERDSVEPVWCLPVVSNNGLMLRKRSDGKFCRLGWFVPEREDWYSGQRDEGISLC
ncbi:hypothetical protein OQA88_6022 [Cercophora sp. LCS_1]